MKVLVKTESLKRKFSSLTHCVNGSDKWAEIEAQNMDTVAVSYQPLIDLIRNDPAAGHAILDLVEQVQRATFFER